MDTACEKGGDVAATGWCLIGAVRLGGPVARRVVIHHQHVGFSSFQLEGIRSEIAAPTDGSTCGDDFDLPGCVTLETLDKFENQAGPDGLIRGDKRLGGNDLDLGHRAALVERRIRRA